MGRRRTRRIHQTHQRLHTKPQNHHWPTIQFHKINLIKLGPPSFSPWNAQTRRRSKEEPTRRRRRKNPNPAKIQISRMHGCGSRAATLAPDTRRHADLHLMRQFTYFFFFLFHFPIHADSGRNRPKITEKLAEIHVKNIYIYIYI